MKKILSFFILLCLMIFGCLHLPIVKQRVATILESKMTSPTMQIKIGSIGWILPGYFCCHNVVITTPHIPYPVTIQKGELYFSLLQYLYKSSNYNASCIVEISYKNEDISLYADLNFVPTAIAVPNCLISSQTWNIHAQGKILEDAFPELSLQISCDNTFLNSDISLTGWGCFDWQKHQIKGSFYSNQLSLYDAHFSQACINTLLDGNNEKWTGTLSASADAISLSTEFTYCEDTSALEITNVQLDGPKTNLIGTLALSSAGLIDGYIDCTIEQLEEYSSYLPLEGRGSVHAFLDLSHYLKKQNTYITLDVENLRLKHSVCQKFSMELDLQDLFGVRKGSIQTYLEGLKTPAINLHKSNMNLQISSSEPSPFQLEVEGAWHAPLNIKAGGIWEYTQSRGALIQLQNLQGKILNTRLFLQEAALIEWSPDIAKVSNFFCHVGPGSINAHCIHEANTGVCKINANSMPTEFLNLLFPYLNLSGSWNLNSDLFAKDKKLEGMISLSMNKKVNDGYFHKKEKSWGHLQMNLENGMLQIHGNLSPGKEDYLQLFASTPFFYDHPTQTFAIDTQDTFSARIIAYGEMEKLLEHLYLEEHHIQGQIDANLFLSQTLERPCIQGDLEIKEGVYKNDYLGLDVFKIAIKAHAEEDQLSFTSFQGTDGLGGQINGWGSLHVSPKNNFPYKIYCNLNHMRVITSDLAEGSLNGAVVLQGSYKQAHLSGNVSFIDSVFHLLEPRENLLPQLPITFINMPNIPPPIQDPPTLLADVRVSVEKNTFLEGRGLSSEVKGGLHLIQGPKNLTAEGELELIDGSYTAFGKMFSLTSGKITLRDPTIYLSVEGVCALPELSAQVRLIGPITSPAITFTSNPQVPLPELFSYILFNKNPSEITALQSLQIAETLLSVTQGSPPPLLAKIRKTLSVDRLALSSMHNDPTKVAVEVGKYVIPGVLLTWSQGIHSHNLSVEIGLRRGFSAQAEINETQQKKYSLRWNHHY